MISKHKKMNCVTELLHVKHTPGARTYPVTPVLDISSSNPSSSSGRTRFGGFFIRSGFESATGATHLAKSKLALKSVK